ncbi:MAG: response regulator transcription factor [Clostridia bacterium]
MNNKPLILVVEDDRPVRNLITLTLASEGYRYQFTETGGAAIMTAISQKPDLMLLDLGLPDMDGVDVILKTRSWTNMPIIIVSSRSDDADKIAALDAGADDYITKPFSVEELLARLRVALRRLQYMRSPAADDEAVFTNGRLRVDYAAGCAYVDEVELHLTPVEYKLLCLMARNVGKVLTHNCFIKEVWQNTLPEDTPSLRVYMATLRKKLETPLKQKLIQTHVGIGYRMLRLTSDKPANDGGLGGGAR